MKLTDTRCRNIKPNVKHQKLFDGGGLYLEVTPTGSKIWKLKYRFLKKEKKLSIGSYPIISLKEAREKRDEAKKLILNNIDPSLAKQQIQKQAFTDAQNTFERIALEWHEVFRSKWSIQHGDLILKRLKRDIFPKMGQIPIKQITPSILLNVLKQIEKRGVFETTKRNRQYCGQIFRYAVAKGLLDRDVSVDIIGAFTHVRVKHFAALEGDDLPEFLNKLNMNEARLFPQTRIAIKLMLLTFVRTNELLNAKWKEINFNEKVWIIPAERMKMRKAHIVPLSTQTVQLFENLKAFGGDWEHCFLSHINPKKTMSNNTILYALYRMGYKGKTTGHGFRSLAMTVIKEKLGYRHEVVDRQLAHSHRNSVDAAYDRAQFLNERKKMMQDWADYIDRMI